MRLFQTAVISLILGLWGCGGRTMLDDYTSRGSSLPPSSGGSSGEADGGVGEGGGGGTDLPGTGDVRVYANGSSVLYELSPDLSTIQSAVPLVGCIDQVLDIAVSAHGSVFATTVFEFYQIEPTSGICTLLDIDSSPNSLTFLPRDASGRELLVGYSDSAYYRIDPKTGKSEWIGLLDAGYFSSGDIAVMPSGRVYLTVTGNGCGDCLAEIDPATGKMIHLVGALGVSDVYGLAAVGDALYGFSFAGSIMRIDTQTAATQIVPLANWTPDVSFLGAASPPSIHK